MADARAIESWKAVLGELQLQVTRPIYETWLKDTEGLAITDDSMNVGVPTSFAIEWLERRMYQLIQRTVHKVAGRPLTVQFAVASNGASDGVLSSLSSGDSESARQVQRPRSGPLNERYTFDSFVVGPSNRLPYSAAWAVAEAPGKVYHPLFIYSGVGLGKTHLLHAIGHNCATRGLNLLYVTCEQFTNEFIGAIRTRTTEEFRAKYRNVAVLLIDDIQFIIGKEQTQEVFFHTFNDLHNSNSQVVLTSDRPPKALSLLEDRLRSRFEWGLIADIGPPDLETRMAIVRSKAELLDIALEDRIVEYAAKKVQKNVRELEGSLTRMIALARLTHSPITLDLAAQAIADFLPDMNRRAIDPDLIIDEVTRKFRVSRQDLIGVQQEEGPCPCPPRRHVSAPGGARDEGHRDWPPHRWPGATPRL